MRTLIIAAALMIAAWSARAWGDGSIWDFEKDTIGALPAGFESAVTLNMKPGKWVVVEDGANRVLAQLDRDSTPRRFAMALVKDASYRDLKISVKAKPVAGGEEMVAGLVWRYRDADNYYVARWNANSVRVDRVVNGIRQLLPPREIRVRLAPDAWHTLTVEHRGEDMQVFMGEQRVFVGKDDAYPAAGRIGVWIKADSVTYFDDLTAQSLQQKK